MILTIPVLLYQLLFVTLLYVASRFGRKPLAICMMLCLAWTATHVFLVPLAVLQTIVILASYAAFRARVVSRERRASPDPQSARARGSGPPP